MRTLYHFLINCSFIFSFIQTDAQLRVASIFGDHAVLQRNKPIPVWGWAGKNEKITVSLNGTTVKTNASPDGRWMVSLPAMQGGGPFSMEISDKSERLILQDIMLGEVWLCGGQSNMEMQVRNVNNVKAERVAAKNPMIRQIKVADTISLKPENEIHVAIPWMIANPETVDSFTAVGYFFAKNLAEKLNVAIGLINANWGGSEVEAWMSRETLLSSAALHSAGEKFPGSWEEVIERNKSRLEKTLKDTATGKFQPPTDDQLSDTGYNFSGWKSCSAPGAWDWMGVFGYRGQGYMQRYIMVNEGRAIQVSTLGLGANTSPYVVFINGKKIAEGKAEPIVINLPAGTWHKGRNLLVLKQGPDENGDWHSMGIMGEGCQLYVKFGREKISLADDEWKLMPAMNEPYSIGKLTNTVATGPYNYMIKPLQPFALRGFIWYQGEANTGRAYEYRTSFQDLIRSWRKDWKEELPFYFAQLSSYGPNQSSNEGSNWAELREAQAMALTLPATGMAVTIDIGNANDIHPKNKQDVGKRLSLIALNNVYHLPAAYKGPAFLSADYQNGTAIVKFQNVDSGLEARDKYGYLKGFEIAGSDRKWYYARATIKDNTVILFHPAVPNPVAVRYAWSDAPADANLYNKEGLPAYPFRTDDWPGLTTDHHYE